MNELLACCLGSFIWGFILWASGSFTKDIVEARLGLSGIGFFIQIVGVIFMSVPFVIAIIGISAFIITSFAKTIPVLI